MVPQVIARDLQRFSPPITFVRDGFIFSPENCRVREESLIVSFKPFALTIAIFRDIQGCGKTSTIKAIAAHTRRHLIEIPLSRIRTCAELTRIFHLNFYEDIALGFTDKVIVFEDIDCMANIIQKRELSSVTGPMPCMEQSQTFSKDFLRDLLGNYPKILRHISTVSYYNENSF